MTRIQSQPAAYMLSQAGEESLDLTSDLRNLLRAEYPNADVDLVSSAAFHIDGQVRALLREGLTIKFGKKPRQWSGQHPHGVSYSRTLGSPLAIALRKLDGAANSKKKENEWGWAKAWHELPLDAIGLLEEVGGRTSFHKFAVNAAGVPIPHPSVVAPLIPLARLKHRDSRRPRQFRQDLHIAEIVRAFERLSGTIVTKPAHEVGASRRLGPIIKFLDEIERFYNERRPTPRHLHFCVQHSGSAWDRIFRTLGRL